MQPNKRVDLSSQLLTNGILDALNVCALLVGPPQQHGFHSRLDCEVSLVCAIDSIQHVLGIQRKSDTICNPKSYGQLRNKSPAHVYERINTESGTGHLSQEQPSGAGTAAGRVMNHFGPSRELINV